MRQLWRERPTAVFVAGDAMALGALRALSRLDVRVPDDLSLVAFGNPDFVRFATPAITTVDLPVAMAGQVAVELALRRIATAARRRRCACWNRRCSSGKRRPRGGGEGRRYRYQVSRAISDGDGDGLAVYAMPPLTAPTSRLADSRLERSTRCDHSRSVIA